MEVNQAAFVVTTAAFSPDGRLILSGGYANTLLLWDVQTGKLLSRFRGHSDSINGVGFSPDGKSALSGSRDRTIRIWDVSSGRAIKIIRLGADRTLSTVFSPDGEYALSAHAVMSHTEIRLWKLSSGVELRRFQLGRIGSGIPGVDLPVAFSADGQYAAMKNRDNNLVLLKIPTGEEITVVAIKEEIHQLAFSPDGKYIVISRDRNQRPLYAHPMHRLIEAATGREVWQVREEGYWNTSTKYSPDGKYILSVNSDGYIKLRDASTGAEVKRMAWHSYSKSIISLGVPKVNFSPDAQYTVNSSQSATRIFNITTGEEVAVMVGFEDGEWLVIASEGYYNASEKGAHYLTTIFEGQDFSVDQFYDVFYRPDIVAAKLQGHDINDLITITMKDAIKSPPPLIEFTSNISESAGSAIKVCYRAKSMGGGIGEVRLFHNGKLIDSDGYYRLTAGAENRITAMNGKAIYENMRSVAVKGKGDFPSVMTKPKGDVFTTCKDVEAVSGENELSIVAFNRNNTVQSPVKTVKVNSTIKPPDPHLYILSIGIDKYKNDAVSLMYAAKDANDIEQKLLKQSATVYKPRNIHCELMTDTTAGKAAILAKIGELSKKVKPNDGFILFVAGHGVLLQNQYYLLTHEFDGTMSGESMISSNELVEMSKKIKSLSQIFIFDTCHAGGVDSIVSGLYDARMSVLAKKMGLHIYASASSLQEAQDGYQGNGLFTFTLLDGLNNRKEADRNNDNFVSLAELGEYAKQATMEISKKNGHVQTPLIINFGKDSPLYTLK